MKSYFKYISEKIKDNFIFAINIRYISYENFDKLFDEIENTFKGYEEYGNHINRKDLQEDIFNAEFNWQKPWALTFNINYRLNDKKVAINQVTTPGWGAGVYYMENIITIEEFLNVGFDGVEEYINMKKNINKYNI
jgi:hypothetical protein